MESFISFYGSQTAEQLKLCISQMMSKELAWRCDTVNTDSTLSVETIKVF